MVNYPPFKSASSVQIPLHGNLPPAFVHPTPLTTPSSTMFVDHKNGGASASGAPTNFYNSNVQMVQPKQISMYSTPSLSSAVTTMTSTCVGSKNNNLCQTPAAATVAAPMKCKNEVNQQNELLKQPPTTGASTTTTTPSNLYPNKMNFIEIDSNRNAKVRPYGGNAINSTPLSSSSSFRNGCTSTVHCPATGEQHKFATSKPDPLEKIPRRMPVQPTAAAGAAAIGMPAAKKLPHSFSSSCVSDLLRANAMTPTTTAMTAITNHSNIVRPANAVPTNQNQNNNFTAQTLLYSRLYPNINLSSAKPLHNNSGNGPVMKSHAIVEGQPQQSLRNNGQMQTPTMPYKPSTQPYALTQSKSATAISRKDTSWLERHGYEIVDMSASMHNDEVAEKNRVPSVCVLLFFANVPHKLSCLWCARARARTHRLPINVSLCPNAIVVVSHKLLC